MFDFTSDEIGNFIDENGKPLKGKRREIEKSIAKAEEITEHLLGCTLVVRDKTIIHKQYTIRRCEKPKAFVRHCM